MPATNALLRNQVVALHELGLNRIQRRIFFEGRSLAFERSTRNAEPMICLIHCHATKIQCGIVDIKDLSGEAAFEFSRFREKAFQVARLCLIDEIEILGIAVINPRIQQMLSRRGFEFGSVEIPEELGGGFSEAFKKSFRIN